MKRRHVPFTLLLLVSFAALGSASAAEPTAAAAETGALEAASAPPDCSGSWRAARLQCNRGASGLVTGNYGGTDFFLTCNGVSETTFCTSGNTFVYIMEGMTPTGPAVRCALSGEARQVNEKCGPLHLFIN